MIRLKDLLKEETFTATNKSTGKTSAFKSKESRDAAIKAGTHTNTNDKTQASAPKPTGNSMFGGDYAKDRGGNTPKTSDLPHTKLDLPSDVQAKSAPADKPVLKGGKWQANPKTANDETQIELDMGFDPRSEREVKQAQAAFKKFNISVKPIGKPSPSGEITYAVNGKKKDILAYIQSSNYEMDATDVEEYYPELLDKGTETKSASKAVIKGGKWQPNPETANDDTKINLDMGWDTGSERENKQAQAAFKKYNISVKPLKRLPSGEIEYEVNGKKKDILAYIQSSNYEMDTDDVKDYYSDLLK
jgi:hypothetical protein